MAMTEDGRIHMRVEVIFFYAQQEFPLLCLLLVYYSLMARLTYVRSICTHSPSGFQVHMHHNRAVRQLQLRHVDVYCSGQIPNGERLTH